MIYKGYMDKNVQTFPSLDSVFTAWLASIVVLVIGGDAELDKLKKIFICRDTKPPREEMMQEVGMRKVRQREE